MTDAETDGRNWPPHLDIDSSGRDEHPHLHEHAGHLVDVLDGFQAVNARDGLVALQCMREHADHSGPQLFVQVQPDDTGTTKLFGVPVSQRHITLADLVEQALAHHDEDHDEEPS